jgi:hypothetical protein
MQYIFLCLGIKIYSAGMDYHTSKCEKTKITAPYCPLIPGRSRLYKGDTLENASAADISVLVHGNPQINSVNSMHHIGQIWR